MDAFRSDFPTIEMLTVAHAAAARERIPVTKPMVVVVASSVGRGELQEIVDAAFVVGAEVVRLSGDTATPVSLFRIKKALLEKIDKWRPPPTQ